MIPFGRRGCVNGRNLVNLAPHLQREGILLMLETGMSIFDVQHETGLGSVQATKIATDRTITFSPDWSL